MFDGHFARYYDLLNQTKPYQKEIEFVYEWAGKPKRILDIGSGTGNYWMYYPKDTRITGVDKSLGMLDQNSKLENSELIWGDATTFDWKGMRKFDCVTALFDVMNYIRDHSFWKRLPLKSGGCFIFDIWDKEKVDKENFKVTSRQIGEISRKITPLGYDGKTVKLKTIVDDGWSRYEEIHEMNLYSAEDILGFCGKEFKIEEVKTTGTWQKWMKLRRK